MVPVGAVQDGCLIAFAVLLGIAAWQDLRTLHVADGISLAIVPLFLVWSVCGWIAGTCSPAGIGLAIACAAGLFAVGMLAFAVGALGGGDVKLLASASLFAGPTVLLVDYLLVTALAGGVLGLAVLAGAPVGPRPQEGIPTLEGGRRARHLPYGPAIAVGGLWLAASLAKV